MRARAWAVYWASGKGLGEDLPEIDKAVTPPARAVNASIVRDWMSMIKIRELTQIHTTDNTHVQVYTPRRLTTEPDHAV